MSFISCAQLPDHIEQQCNDFKKGGFPALAILEKDHTITDFEDATQWQTNISSGKVRIVNRIKANLPEPSAVKVDNPVACGAEQILDGFDWTAEWTDANVSTANDDFYKTLNIKESYLVLYNCDNEEIRVIADNVTFEAKPMYPASNKEFQSYKVIASWSTSADVFPVLYNAPAGIFSS